jgi:hypothetical protein
MTSEVLGVRLWRARRRHDHVDAVLRQDGAGWLLQFFHNDRSLLAWPYPDPESARAEAAERLRALQRAGWNVHW